MKKVLLTILLFSLTVSFSNAQLSKVSTTPEFESILEKIVLDFRKDFNTIQGEQIEKLGEVDVFESALTLPGTINNRIIRYHSRVDTSSSFQAIVYKDEDYKEAMKAYQNIYRALKRSRIYWIDRSIASLKGQLQAPNENVRFAVSTLVPNIEDARYRNFKVEVELVNTYYTWEVRINMHNKRPDNEPFAIDN